MGVVALPLLFVGHSKRLRSWSDQRQRVSSVVWGSAVAHAPAYRASWVNALHMILKRDRSVAEEVVRNLHDPRVDCVNLWAAASFGRTWRSTVRMATRSDESGTTPQRREHFTNVG